MNITIKKASALTGSVQIPGDKSISHRGIMFGAISKGSTRVTNFLQGADCLSTISCFQKLGIDIENRQTEVIIHGKGIHGLRASDSILDTGNSGTTTRLISGILAGQDFTSTLTGDASIQSRPMGRIIAPLTQMGATLKCLQKNDCVPMEITGHSLNAIHYTSPVASAQVKSCILLAGLYGNGTTSVTEPALSRNHTELMLSAFGADIKTNGTTASIEPEPDLRGTLVEVPGDISSAAYWIAAALLVPGSELYIRNVGINPTRDGILKVVAAMGGKVKKENIRTVSGESVCDLLVNSSELTATRICGDLIPSLIDEIPVLAVLACFAKGTTVIADAKELKVKESNRIDTVVQNLKLMGADIEATEDGMIIQGNGNLHGAVIDSHLDHRIAMAFSIAGLMCPEETTILQADSVAISYPDFHKTLSGFLS